MYLQTTAQAITVTGITTSYATERMSEELALEATVDMH
ncbi:RHS repeat-associated core domain protein [Leptospira santarosai]|nr:RHS repeat-associated core domain protein [Leptospira santarosai]